MTFTKKQVSNGRNIIITSALTVASHHALGLFFPKPIPLISTATLVAHEMGHYYSAHMRGGDPDIPIVIPMGVASIGVTRVRKMEELSLRTKRYIVASGAFAGAATLLSLVPYAINHAPIGMLALFVALTGEIFSLTIGSDGAKIRRFNEQA